MKILVATFFKQLSPAMCDSSRSLRWLMNNIQLVKNILMGYEIPKKKEMKHDLPYYNI